MGTRRVVSRRFRQGPSPHPGRPSFETTNHGPRISEGGGSRLSHSFHTLNSCVVVRSATGSSSRRAVTFGARHVEPRQRVHAVARGRRSRRRARRAEQWRTRQTEIGGEEGRCTRPVMSWCEYRTIRERERARTCSNTSSSWKSCSDGTWSRASRFTIATGCATTTDRRTSNSGRGRSLRAFASATRSRGRAQFLIATALRVLAHLQQCSRTNPEHSWRWRESNPRLPSCWWDFSERSRWEVSLADRSTAPCRQASLVSVSR